jgi:hypothetical protein
MDKVRRVLVAYGSEPTRTKIIQISNSSIPDASFLKTKMFDTLKAENYISQLGGNECSTPEDVILFYDDPDFNTACELSNDMEVKDLTKMTLKLRQQSCKLQYILHMMNKFTSSIVTCTRHNC